MPRLSRRLSSSARKAALAFRTRVNSLNLPGIGSGTLGRSWSWRSNARTNSAASSSTASATPSTTSSAGGTSDTATDDHLHARTASEPLDHGGNDEDDGLRRHSRWASAPTQVSASSPASLDPLDGGDVNEHLYGDGDGDGDGDDSATVVDLAHDTLAPSPPHPTRPAPRPPNAHQVAPSWAADDSALSPLDMDSNMFASFTTVVGGESSSSATSAAALAAEPHHAHAHHHYHPNSSHHRHRHHPQHTPHHSHHDPIPTPASTNASASSLDLDPQSRDSSMLAPSLVVGDAAAQHMFVPSTLSSFSDPRQPPLDDTILDNPHHQMLLPSDFDATLDSTMIPGLDLVTVSPMPQGDAMSTTSTVIRAYTPPLAAASSSSSAAAHHPSTPSSTHLPMVTAHAQLPSSPLPTIPRRRSLSASTLDRVPTFGRRRSSSSESTSSTSLVTRERLGRVRRDHSLTADQASTRSSESGAGTVVAQGNVSPTGTLDTIRRADTDADAGAQQQRPDHGMSDDYESQLARLAFEYHEELARVQVEREALVAELARVRAQAAAAASEPKPAHADLVNPADQFPARHGRADTSDSDDAGANTTISSLVGDTASARTAETAGTAKKKRVSFDSETLLAQLEASQLARQRADNTIRRLQEQLDLLAAGSAAAQAQSGAYFPVSAREFKMIRDSAADVEMLAHAVQARVRRFEADRGVGVGDESGSESESESEAGNQLEKQVKTRVGEEDKWERAVALVAHVVKGTDVIVREASAIFDWAASAGHPIASPEELEAWHADRGIVLRVMRAAQSVVDAAAASGDKVSSANVGEQQQQSAAVAVDVCVAKTVAVGACVQLAGWVQLIESAVGDITDSLRV